MATRRQYLVSTASGTATMLGLTGCLGSDDQANGDQDGDGSGGGQTTTTSGGDTGVDLTIGVLTMLELDTGRATERGTELAARKINEEGILDGELSVESADTEGQSTGAVNGHNSLVNRQNADVTLGTFAEQTAAAIMPEIASSETIHLNVGAISPKLPAKVAEDYEKFKPWFRFGAPNAEFFVVDMIQFAEKFLVGEQGWESTVLFREDALWTDQVGGALKQQFPEVGLEVKDDVVFSLSESNFSTYMNRMEDMDVDCIFGLVAEAGKAPMLGYEKSGLETPMAGSLVASMSPSYLDDIQAEGSNIVTQLFTTWGAKLSDSAKAFVDAYQAEYSSRPRKPTWAAFISYAATMSYAQAYAEGGGTLDGTITALENGSYTLNQKYEVYKPGETAEATGNSYPHDLKVGPDNYRPMWGQWQSGDLEVVYPDEFASAEFRKV